ncbi:MAG TPA: hypothetical protein VH518_20260 [Tepidisphaeraceae bacterium]|jgi:hypothetical protein
MKIFVAIIAVVTLAALVVVIVQKRKSVDVELTSGELKIREVVREVYAGNIVAERIERRASDAVLIAELRNEKLKELTINLSSLARKCEKEGLSVPAQKAALRFD